MNGQTGQAEQRKGRISQLGVLDLRNARSIDELRHIEEISEVGMILLSDDFADSLASIPMRRVGSIVRLPAGSRVNLIDGSMRIGGEFLERPAADGADILLVGGELWITSPFQSVAYRQVIVTGQLIVPRESESVLSPFVTRMSGQIIACDHRNPRMFMGQGRFGKVFFEMMKEPVTLILMGEFVIESDVSTELLREKTAEIILMGELKAADRRLVPILQALAVVQQGVITAESPGDGWHDRT